MAKAAGVSTATVSRVINGQTVVTPATRERVLSAVRRLGYQHNALAASLVKRRSNTLGVIIPDISNPFFPDVVRGLEDLAHKAGYNVILCNADLNLDKELEYFEVLRQKRVDGIIYHSGTVTPRHLKAFEQLRLPIVLAATIDPNRQYTSVMIDNRAAAAAAMAHLLELGHQQVAVITGHDPVSGEARLQGYRDAMAQFGLELTEADVARADWDEAAAYAAASRLLVRSPAPTAFAVASDLMALGAMAAVHDAGLRIPDDISIVGFDDIKLAATVRPRLTTVAQPLYEMGKRAAALLIDTLARQEEDTVGPVHEILPFQLVVRETTAGPPPGG